MVTAVNIRKSTTLMKKGEKREKPAVRSRKIQFHRLFCASVYSLNREISQTG